MSVIHTCPFQSMNPSPNHRVSDMANFTLQFQEVVAQFPSCLGQIVINLSVKEMLEWPGR